jgi:hypothetical protein
MKRTAVAHVGWLILALASGCVRLGYDSKSPARDPKLDASHEDAGKLGNDGGASDAAGDSDASGMDASQQDASMLDGGTDSGKSDSGNNPNDSGKSDSGNNPNDSGMQDSGPSDSGMDTGPEDAAMQDAEVDSGAISSKWCPERTDAIICDDFEDSSLMRWEYSVLTSGTVAHSTTRAHSGTGSFRATTQTSMTRNSEARRGTKAFDHVTSGDIWMRYYYYVPSSVSINAGFSTCPIAEIEAPYFGFAFHIRPTDVQLGVEDTMYPSTTMSTAFPRDQWVCIEIHVQIDPSKGRFEAFMNGALVVQTPETDTLPDMGYSSVDIGIHYADPTQGPVTVYVDDLIAGFQRYGCN